MGISFSSFSVVLPFVTAINKPILLRARHGVGKSALVYQYANSIKLPVIERRISQMTEGDIIGLPKLTEKGTQWILPDWVLDACENPVVLFLDELDRGTLEVRQAIFELTDSRKIAGHYLHPGTLIFAAINGSESSSQYQVGEMDPAELDRWTVFDLEPTVEDWLTWAKNHVDSIVWDFINQNNSFLEHSGDFEPNKVYPSRRSWHRFSDCLVKGKESLIQKENTASPTLLNLCTAFCGFETAIAFGDFMKNYKFIVNPKDILDKGDIESTSKFQINDHLALVEKFVSYFSNEKICKLTQKQLTNLAKYFVTLPSEIAMKMIESIATGGPEFIKSFHKTPGVKDYLVKILTVENESKKSKK